MQESGARVMLKEVGDPERYGVAALDERKILSIEEKPAAPKSNYAVRLLRLRRQGLRHHPHAPSDRGRTEITDVNNEYIETRARWVHLRPLAWTDAGTFESLANANELLEDRNEIRPDRLAGHRRRRLHRLELRQLGCWRQPDVPSWSTSTR